jgi:hypothetical protein
METDKMTVNNLYIDSRSDEERAKDEMTTSSTTTSGTNNGTAWTTVGDEITSITVGDITVDEHKDDDIIEKENEEKFGFMEVGPTTFAELDDAREAHEEVKGIQKLVSDFMALVGNIMSFPGGNKKQEIKDLLEEMKERIPEEDEEEEEEEEETKEVITVESNKSMFMIWKDDASGEFRWLGIYSNKFRDNDSPAEILAEKAHLHFIKRVENGDLPYPDLYVWHIPVAVGKADLLAYDNAGFSVASGTIEEDFAYALKDTSEDLAMSHGMPAASIRRDDEEDKTIITEYASSEVSVLPRYAAANKMTDFQVLQEEEKAMAIIPDEKRQQVASLLGDELTDKLEAGLADISDKAIADGIEFKEESEEVVEEPEAEAIEEEVSADESKEEPLAVTEEEAVDSVDETADDGAEVPAEEPVVDSVNVTKEELAEVLATIVDAFSQQSEKMTDLIEGLVERMEKVESNVHVLGKSDEEKVAELAASTPEASLQALLASQLSGRASTVIGNPATKVHGNTSLAKESPQETHEEEGEDNTGLFFRQFN